MEIAIWGSSGEPLGFSWQGTSRRIAEICNRWRLHTLWWDPDRVMWREYLKVSTADGCLCQIYHDLLGDGWFLARVYD
jgi:hypothetical protein